MSAASSASTVPASDGSTAAPAGRVVLELRDVVKRREQVGSDFELRVPELVLERGLYYGVCGPSGSGKSTLLDLLALVLRPTRAARFTIAGSAARPLDVGALWLRDDESGLAQARKSLFGYVLQSGGLIGFLTVRQNLEIPYQLLARRIDTARIERMAERFGVASELDKKPRHLSGGQRQRVAILRALMTEPALILADEPTAAVDQLRARQIVAEMRTIAREAGSTIVMVSHDRELVDSCADRVLGLAVSAASDGTALSVARWEN